MRPPAQDFARPAAVGDQFRRVALAPGSEYVGHGTPRDLFRGPDNFSYGKSPARTQIQDAVPAAFLQPFHGGDMGLGQVAHVHVIADAGAVGG